MNRQSFESLESLETRTFLDATLANGVLSVVGSNAADAISVSLNQNNQIVADINGTQTTFDPALVNSITMDALAGNDTINNGVNRPATINGGEGNDEINGGDGIEQLNGNAGDDRIDGNKGNDISNMGDGDDVFVWDPGDGSDVVEGDAGFDELQFNGAAGDEIFDLSPNGTRARFFRNLGNIVMDLNKVERVDLEALGGADQITVNELTGTDVRTVDVSLAGPGNTGLPDGAIDAMIVKGTNAKDEIVITGDAATGIVISGLLAEIRFTQPDATDTLRVDARGQSDRIDASALSADAAKLTLVGSTGHDTLLGGAGEDLLDGGSNNDVIDGNRGNDTANMGADNDTFIWDPGDGSDVIEGQAGFDTMRFNGSAGDEIMEASANGDRLRFTRNLGNIVMDAASTEKLDVRALGGNDLVTIGDLRSTPTTQTFVDGGEGNDSLIGGPRRDTFFGGLGEDELRGNGDIDVLDGASSAGDDNQPDDVFAGSHNDFVTFGDGDTFDLGAGSDSLIFNGTNRSDAITVEADTSSPTPIVSFVTNRGTKSAALANAEIITVNASSGNDTVVMSEAAGLLSRANFNGGSGNDLLVGGSLDDILNGETGSDVLLGQGGTDALNAGSGKNTVVQ